MTDNGVMRIVGHPRYPDTPGSPSVFPRSLPGHSFWPGDFRLVGCDLVDAARILTPAQVTDTHLLALAASKGGQLTTFDRKLSTDTVRRGKAALYLIAGG